MQTLALDAVNVAAETTIINIGPSQTIVVYGYQISGSVAGNVLFRNGLAGVTLFVVPVLVAVHGPGVLFDNHGIALGTGNDLTADGPLLATISGTIFYDVL